MEQVLHTILAHDQSQDIVELVQLLLDDEDDEDDEVADVGMSLVTMERAKTCDSQDGVHCDVVQLRCHPILMELVTSADLLAQVGDQEHVIRLVNHDFQRVFLSQTHLRLIHGIEI